MALEDDIVIFQHVPTFAVLGKQALRILAIGAESRTLQSGAVLFRAGDHADAGYLVQQGSVLLEQGAGADSQSYTVGAGTLLAELALFTDVVSPVTATAQETDHGLTHFAQPVPQDAGRLSDRRQEIARYHRPPRRRLDARPDGHAEDDRYRVAAAAI